MPVYGASTRTTLFISSHLSSCILKIIGVSDNMYVTQFLARMGKSMFSVEIHSETLGQSHCAARVELLRQPGQCTAASAGVWDCLGTAADLAVAACVASDQAELLASVGLAGAKRLPNSEPCYEQSKHSMQQLR